MHILKDEIFKIAFFKTPITDKFKLNILKSKDKFYKFMNHLLIHTFLHCNT